MIKENLPSINNGHSQPKVNPPDDTWPGISFVVDFEAALARMKASFCFHL